MKSKRKLKNYGLKIDEITDEDYIFGSALPYEELTDGNWSPYLPKKEIQNLNGIEPYACVVFTILNCVEILIKRQYGEERNFSDRFLSALVNTRDGGSTPKEVCQFLRKIGVVPEDVWSFDETIDTEDKFFAKLPPELYKLAREFNEEWDFRYEIVPSVNEEIEKALKCSPLGISVTAWFERGSVYYKPEGMKDNHFTTLVQVEKSRHKRVFDSYDSVLKDYEYETKHSVIQRYRIQKRESRLTWWQKVLNFLKNWD